MTPRQLPEDDPQSLQGRYELGIRILRALHLLGALHFAGLRRAVGDSVAPIGDVITGLRREHLIRSRIRRGSVLEYSLSKRGRAILIWRPDGGLQASHLDFGALPTVEGEPDAAERHDELLGQALVAEIGEALKIPEGWQLRRRSDAIWEARCRHGFGHDEGPHTCGSCCAGETYPAVQVAALNMLRSQERAAQWMSEPNMRLGGLTPIETLAQPGGRSKVLQLIGRMSHGVW